MNKNDVVLHDRALRNNFLRQCLFNEYDDGYQEALSIVASAENSDQVIARILSSDTMRGTQIYAELSKDQPDHWKRLSNDIDGWYETISDVGALRIGSDNFSIDIPNGYGDGPMRFAVVNKGCFNHNMLNFWTSIDGHEIDVYDYDCQGGNVVVTLDGRFGVYNGYGFVVFERWGDAA